MLHLPRPALRAAALALLASLAGAQTTWIVDQVGFDFVPQNVTIAPGDTVEWRWSDGMHDVTSGTDGSVDGDEAFQGPLDAGNPTFSVTFDQAFLQANPVANGVYAYFCSFHFFFGQSGTVTVKNPLVATPTSISLATGGTQTFTLDMPATFGGDLYLVGGTSSGTSPGLVLDGVTIPLNLDSYLLFTLTSANAGPYANTLGFLDASGDAAGSITIPSTLNPALAGLVLQHAAVVFDLPGTGVALAASNAAALRLVP